VALALACPSFLAPLLLLRPSFPRRKLSKPAGTFTIASRSGSTKLPEFDVVPNLLIAQPPTSKPAMDSMPIRGIPVVSHDALKLSDPGTDINHVEHVNAPATTEHHEHLPKGISETDEEKRKGWFIGSIDCGTTSSRFLIFDGEGTPVASHQIEFENIYPESG
jgi:glycerol kinase